MKLDFLGGAYEGRSKNLNAEKCINFFLEPPSKQRNEDALVGTPGLREFTQPKSGEVRGLYQYDNHLYAVIANEVFRVDEAGAYISLGKINTFSGQVSMDDNGATNLNNVGRQIMMVDGQDKWIISDGMTLTQAPTTDNFDKPSRVIFQDGYFLYLRKNTGQLQWTNSYNGMISDALDIGSAEGRADNLVSLIADRREIFLLGEETGEIWYNTGDIDTTFGRFQGGFVQVGCVAPHTLQRFDNSLLWLSKNERGGRQVVRAKGDYQPEVISAPGVNYQISTYSTVSDAFAFTYQNEGHEFYVLTFPTENVTWAYDALTKEWHQWASTIDGTYPSRHRSNCHCYCFGRHLVGDFINGKIYELSTEFLDDDGETIIRDRISPHGARFERRIRLSEVQVEFEEGVGSGVLDPQAMLRWSKDGGHTWSDEQWRGIGKIGQYALRAVWRKLGFGRKWTFWLRVSDSVKWIVSGAYIRQYGEPVDGGQQQVNR